MDSIINLYPSDVRSLSDEELRVLSEELSEEYQQSGTNEDYDDYDYWTSDTAEARYYEMRREIRRRWEAAHPNWKSLDPNGFLKDMLRILADGFAANRALNRSFEEAFCGPEDTRSGVGIEAQKKVGDIIVVRAPARFRGTG